MKKYIIAAMLLILGMSAFAQDFTDGAGTHHIGFNLGFTDPILREKTNKDQEKFTNYKLPGLKAGLVYETSFVKGLGMQLGLNYTFGTKQGKELGGNSAGTTFKTKEDWFIHQVELPIYLQYKFEVAKETFLVLYTGPTAEMGIGFSKNNISKRPNTSTGKIEESVSKLNLYERMYSAAADPDNDGIADHYQRFNLTWGVGAGLQYQRYFLRGGYDFGIFNPYSDHYNNLTDFRRKGRLDQWSLKLGIYLWNF